MANYHIVPASKTASTKEELVKITGTFMEGKTASVQIHIKDGAIQEITPVSTRGRSSQDRTLT